jgi:AAA15 family ATPase/GTPase
MNRIKVKNFGAIKEGAVDDWIELNQTTIFYGEPNTGKTTILKLIALFTWLEKQVELKRVKLSDINPIFSKRCFYYYGLTDGFFNNNTVIECEGQTHRFTVGMNKDFCVEIKTEKICDEYKTPNILFVPQNRYLLSEMSFIDTVKNVPKYLADFLSTWDRFLRYFEEKKIPIPGYKLDLYYNSFNEILYVKGKNFETRIQEASQTIKHIAPLLLVSKQYLGLDTFDNSKCQKRSLEEMNVIREEIVRLCEENNKQGLPLDVLNFMTKQINEYNYSVIDDVSADYIPQIPLNENGNKTVISMSLLEKSTYRDLCENTNYYKMYKNGKICKM